ncbi:MAG TPA: hypothetical protein VK502_03410 [Candidatus Saccharimonadales bacterium]|nr:hypothetical protein [Candidatus Saccharimonadales bacterium]
MSEHEPPGEYVPDREVLIGAIDRLIEAHFARLPGSVGATIDFSAQVPDMSTDINPELATNYTYMASTAKELDFAFERALLQEAYGNDPVIDVLMLDYPLARVHHVRYRAISYLDHFTSTLFYIELLAIYDKKGTKYAHRNLIRKSDEAVTDTASVICFNGKPAYAERNVGATKDEPRHGAEESPAKKQARALASSLGLNQPLLQELQQIIADIEALPDPTDIDL